MMAKRSTKEPEVAPESVFAPVIAQLRTMVRGFASTLSTDDTSEDAQCTRSRIEGLESAILLCQRAGAGEVVHKGEQRLVKLAPRAPEHESLEARVARLERLAETHDPTRIARHVAREVTPLLDAPKAKAPRGAGELGTCARAILRVLVQRDGSPTTAKQAAILSEYRISSGGFAGALAELRRGGFATGSASDLRVTSDGKRVAGRVEPLPTGAALVDHWIASLPAAEGKILSCLCGAHPRALSMSDLVRVTGYSATSGGFAGALATLRQLELISRGWPAKASDVFFEGSRR